ncbi:hypothetical protein [Moorena sp. SIO3B2]|uniref:hypothetical protein n=1 Tax=Moorena sp. SIO3B2 TaxID=2607827 RepID=UPI0013CCBCBC|nr:hypothetical protein [Moorena sp. SIO3B2]NEP31867.1 helix-turn-helix domain-containing protein [Moorena sp. SIO3B2]
MISAIDDGMVKTQASRLFKISRNTIDIWLKKRNETGYYRPKEGYQKGYNPKIADLERFSKFVQSHGSSTQNEMAEAWSEKM